MICQNCQAEVTDLPYCPHCGFRLDGKDDHPPQNTTLPTSDIKRARRHRFRRRWILPLFALLAIIAFGILGLALMGFRDGSRDRELANQHQAEIHYNRGLVYMEWGQYQLAEAEFEEAVRLSPGYMQADRSRRTAQAEQVVTPTTTPQPTALPSPTIALPTSTPAVVVVPVAQALYEQGLAHFERGEWQEAISTLEQLRSEDATFRSEQVLEMLVDSHTTYAGQLEEQDQIEEAISHYDSALFLKRRDPELEEKRRRADLYMKGTGVWGLDWDTAIINLTALYALAPDYRDTAQRLYDATTTYAHELIKSERYCAAAELYEQALNIHDDDPEIVKLEDDARHICQVSTPAPAATKAPNGAPTGQVHLGTIVASCYDHRSDQSSLCAQNADDNQLRTVLPLAEQPALTLDGTMLAYRSTDPSQPGLYVAAILSQVEPESASQPVTATLTVTTTQTATAERVTLGTPIAITAEPEAHYPTWSPDGTRVAYSLYDDQEQEWFIYVALPDGTTPPRRIHQGEWPTWGPTGLLAFTTCTDEELCGIHIFNPADWSIRRLTDSVQDRATGWSPSGDEIAYMSDIGRSFNLYVVHAQSNHVRQITRDLFTDLVPTWSPDGQRIAYVTNRDDDWSLYTQHPYGNRLEHLTPLGAQSADSQRFRLSWVARVLRFPDTP
jgi:tetratricopeptide (TPR) repeat protein